MNFFSSDEELHEDSEQRKRQKSALSLKMDSVNIEQQTGIIKDYEVSLDCCTCVDFSRRHKPCKHMYCLAMELGVFEIDNVENEMMNLKKFANENIPYVYSSYRKVPKNFVVIDFETANKSPDSVCQMGIVTVKEGQIINQKSFLIRPPYTRFIFSDIHGITFNDVKKSPTFADLWSEINQYVENQTIAAYNLTFDWRCLWATLDYYNIPHPSVEAFDVLANVKSARELCFENYKLLTVARELGINHKPHDALSDATVTAKIELYLTEKFPDMFTQIYISSFEIMLNEIARGKIPIDDIIIYGNNLLNEKEVLDYEEYKKLFITIEQIAAVHSNASLYKLCGLFYEKCNRIPRAIALYKKSLSIDSGMKLKTRIQRLERIANQKM